MGQAGVPMQVSFAIIDSDFVPPNVYTFEPVVSAPVDVTEEDVTVHFTVTAEDNISGIHLPLQDPTGGWNGYVPPPEGPQVPNIYFDHRGPLISPYTRTYKVPKDRFGFPVIIAQDNLRQTFTVSTVIPRGEAPGVYKVTLVLADKLNNLCKPETSITVVNRGLVDTDPPKVLSFNATPNVIPYVNPGPGQVHTFNVTMTVQDDLSGIASAEVVIIDFGDFVHARWAMNETTPVVDGVAKTFRFSLPVLVEFDSFTNNSLVGGIRQLLYRVTLIDRVGKRAECVSYRCGVLPVIWVNLKKNRQM